MNVVWPVVVVLSLLALACGSDVTTPAPTGGQGATGAGGSGQGGSGGSGGSPGQGGSGGSPGDESKRFGNDMHAWGNGVATDSSGNVVITGYFGGSVDFGGGPLSSAGLADFFVAKYDGNGNHLWSKRFGDSSSESGAEVATDGSGNVVITAGFEGSVDFGGGPLSSAGLADIFVAKFDGSGNHLWSKRFGDSSSDKGASVATDGSGSVVITGYFFGSVDFGSGPLTSASNGDGFVAKVAL